MHDTMPMTWAKHMRKDRKQRCAYCGRLLNGAHLRIEVIDGGANVLRPGVSANKNAPGYVGFVWLGPECAKQFEGFVHTI